MEQMTELLCYLDPATGSLTFQILIGGLLAFVATCRGYVRRTPWLKLLRFWRKKR
jgi:hypothetical protein